MNIRRDEIEKKAIVETSEYKASYAVGEFTYSGRGRSPEEAVNGLIRSIYQDATLMEEKSRRSALSLQDAVRLIELRKLYEGGV